MEMSCRVLAAWVVGCCVASAQAQNVKAVKVGPRIDVTVDGAFFTSYRFSSDEKYPFFFPVNGPSGASVTSMRNGEFPHHCSLFFGCDRVNGGNYWQVGLDPDLSVRCGGDMVNAQGESGEKQTWGRIQLSPTCADHEISSGATAPFLSLTLFSKGFRLGLRRCCHEWS